MSFVAISGQNVSKRYSITRAKESYLTFREIVANTVSSSMRRLVTGKTPTTNESNPDFWALQDVSFDIQAGETVGIIGRNGAGKSTLLKLISQITEPTRGEIRLRGRVGTLLEIGTGFHPELTGRENIYLYGAILGMRRTEIARKFDEIVDFSEIEEFIETPVKRYSSGMHMRLAFSVAAFLETEILLVDEVLAVGDSRFQQKCLGKMEDVGGQGRTVLFVSHNMPSITRLCSRALLLHEGKLIMDGAAPEVASKYLGADIGGNAVRVWEDPANAPGDNVARLRSVRIIDQQGRASANIDIRQPVGVELEYDILQSGYNLIPGVLFQNSEGVNLFVSLENDPKWVGKTRPAGHYRSVCWVPGNYLAEGLVYLRVTIRRPDSKGMHFRERDVVSFYVVDSMEAGGARINYVGNLRGVVRPMLDWTTEIV